MMKTLEPESVPNLWGRLSETVLASLYSMPATATKPRLSQHGARGYYRIIYRANGIVREIYLGNLNPDQSKAIDLWLHDGWPDETHKRISNRLSALRHQRNYLRMDAVKLADECGYSFRGHRLHRTQKACDWGPKLAELNKLLTEIQSIHWQMVSLSTMAADTAPSQKCYSRLMSTNRAAVSAMTKVHESQKLLSAIERIEA